MKASAEVIAALVVVERGHVVYGRGAWTGLTNEQVAELVREGLAESIEPPAWLRRIGRKYCLALTQIGRASLPWRY